MKKTILLLSLLCVGIFANAQKFFNVTDHRGALGSVDWTLGWTNWDPQNANYGQTNATLSGYITSDMTLDASKVYLLSGFVYVTNNATLTIPAGTIIRGDKATKGTLVITRNGKLNVNGTANSPVVFTSNEAVGDRDYGDWGGLIILGKANANPAGGEGTIEGGVNDSLESGRYGGTDNNHSSGSISYLRVEFPGIAYQPNNEINGITMGGVGAGTTIRYVQVSYSGDDSYEWFGGNVNCKFLVAHRGWDDDFDCDFGYSGKVQFGIVVRDPAIADVSGSNAFECDNDGTGSDNSPFTSATFSNITVMGPAVIGTPNANYKRALHLRRNSRMKIFNSIFAGYPTGLLLDGAKTIDAFKTGAGEFKSNIIACCTKPLDTAAAGAQAGFDIATWFATGSFSDTIITQCNELKFKNTTLTAVDANLLAGSPALTGGNWNHATLANDYMEGLFVGKLKSLNAIAYPNPAKDEVELSVIMDETDAVTVQILNISGQVVSTVLSNEVFVAGSNNIKINTSSLESGLYIVSINGKTGMQSIKLSVVR